MTTDLEVTWPDNGKIFFLGDWCCRHNRKHVWDKLDYSIPKFHWHNRRKLKHDYHRLQSLNKALLYELTPILNCLHNQNRSQQFWELLIGYWLNTYTAVLLDRWTSLQSLSPHKAFRSYALPMDIESLACKDTYDFQVKSAEDTIWNHHLFSKLLESHEAVELIRIAPLDGETELKNGPQDYSGSRFKFLKLAALFLANKFKRNDKYFIISSYMPQPCLIWLEMLLGQFPIPHQSITDNIVSDYDWSMRRWKIEKNKCSGKFENLARTLLPILMPRIFLEGFSTLLNFAKHTPWPARPKLIFTSNSHFYNDIFKAWAAEKISHGAKLVIGEHGGLTPADFNGAHQYELNIADLYLTTGATGVFDHNKFSIGNFRKPLFETKPLKSGKAVLVCVNFPRHASDLRSQIISSQMQNYFQEQFRFVNSLPSRVKMQTEVRLYHHDYDWDQQKRWEENANDIKIGDSSIDLWDQAKSCRLVISTYAGSTYLEALSQNFPSVIFWDQSVWELNPRATELLMSLKEAGVFHPTPESAAQHVEKIWDNIDDWWHSPSTQKAVGSFCKAYCSPERTSLRKLSKTFRTLF